MTRASESPDWWLYVLECQGGVLYTGIAKDVDARFASHVAGKAAAFTRAKPPKRILARASVATQGEALRAEYAFKQMPRVEKLAWVRRGLERFVAACLAAPPEEDEEE